MRSVGTGVRHAKQATGRWADAEPTVVRPVDDPEARAIAQRCERKRTEVGQVPLLDDRLAADQAEGRSLWLNLVPSNGLQAPVAEEQVAAITGG